MPSGEDTSETASVPRKPASPSQGHPKTHTATKPKKPRLTEEEKRARNRKRAAERRRNNKEKGICVRCPNKPIEGQTRCAECAEKHRAQLRPYTEARRRAQGAKPTQPISEAELLQLIQAEVNTRGSQVSEPSVRVVHPDTPSPSRAQGTSLGICRDCNYPSEDGHTRCTLCLLRLRLASRRRRAKAPPVPTTASKADTAGRTPPIETPKVNHGGNRQ